MTNKAEVAEKDKADQSAWRRGNREEVSVSEIDLDAFKGFTPGPWFPTPNDHYWEIKLEDFVHSLGVGDACQSKFLDGVKDGGEANARLMAAAPDLLALAKQQREEIERLQKALADQTFNLAYAAEQSGKHAQRYATMMMANYLTMGCTAI